MQLKFFSPTLFLELFSLPHFAFTHLQNNLSMVLEITPENPFFSRKMAPRPCYFFVNVPNSRHSFPQSPPKRPAPKRRSISATASLRPSPVAAASPDQPPRGGMTRLCGWRRFMAQIRRGEEGGGFGLTRSWQCLEDVRILEEGIKVCVYCLRYMVITSHHRVGGWGRMVQTLPQRCLGSACVFGGVAPPSFTNRPPFLTPRPV